jgi:hypothetical protein
MAKPACLTKKGLLLLKPNAKTVGAENGRASKNFTTDLFAFLKS